MSIASEITRISDNIADAYTVCDNKGAIMPATQNSDNLATTINSITGGGSTPVITSLNVTPTTSAQTITVPLGTDGYSPVNVSAVTSSIDSNIIAGNIKKDVSILGITGTYEGTTPILTTKTITQNGTYNASSDNADGYSSVTVNVSGGGSSIGLQREVVNGKYSMPTTSFIFSLPSNVTDIDTYAMYYAFNGCTGLTLADLSNLTTVSGDSAMRCAFQLCSNLTSVDLSSLTTVSGQYAMRDVFSECRELTSIDLSSLTTLSNTSVMYRAFFDCTKLTSIDFSSLTTVSGSTAMSYALGSCMGLTTLSFPSLISTGFGSNSNQFNNMLQGVTGCTVHFPSNLQSVIGNWSSVTNGFGGTNTTVLFDLPATT